MDVLIVQSVFRLGLDCFGLGCSLGNQTGSIEHVQKIGVSPGIELVGALQFHPPVPKEVGEHPMDNGGAQLGFDIISDNGQSCRVKSASPVGIAGDKDRHVVDERDPCLKSAFGVKGSGLV